MSRIRMITAGLLLGVGIAAIAHADPLDSKQIPEDAKYVLHVDMDAARDTKLWQAVDNQISTNQDLQNGLQQIEQVTGTQFPRDFHDATIYGRSADDEAAVVIIHAHFDRQRMLGFLRLNPSYSSKTVGDYELVTWDDKGKLMHGAFHDDSTVVISKSEDLVRDALDVMDGKAASIKSDSPLAAGDKPQLIAFVAGTGLSDLKKQGEAQNPVMGQLQSAWFSLNEADDNAVIKANITATTPDAAEQLTQLVGGAKAFVAFAAQSPNAKPRDRANAQAISSLLKTLNIKRDDKTLTVDWSIPITQGEKALDAIKANKAAPTTAPDNQ